MDKGNVDIVLVRMDKIGDLVLSLPVDEHPALGGKQVVWFITKGLGFITDNSVPKRTAVEFERGFSFAEYKRMKEWFKSHAPQTVVLLHCPWWVSMAAARAGVPERIGRLSQWHSLFFLNIRVRQKRSHADRHESDFNFDLVEWGFNRLGLLPTTRLLQLKQTFLRLAPPNPAANVSTRGLKAGAYRVVHPGMAGSALNWPKAHYVELIETLAKEMPVVITGTKTDREYLLGIESVKKNPNVKWLVGKVKVRELLDILAHAKSVTAPSTGVLHLAASLGTPAIGIYSPRKVEHPRRWGPKGPLVTFLLPAVPEAKKYPPEVMSEITPVRVLESIHALERGDARHAPDLHPRI